MERSSSAAQLTQHPVGHRTDRKSADGPLPTADDLRPPAFARRPDDPLADGPALSPLDARRTALPDGKQALATARPRLDTLTDLHQMWRLFDEQLAQSPLQGHEEICREAHLAHLYLDGDPAQGLAIIERRLGPVMAQPTLPVLNFARNAIRRSPQAGTERVARLLGGREMSTGALDALLAEILRNPVRAAVQVPVALRALLEVTGDAPPTLRRIAEAVATSATLPAWPLEERLDALTSVLNDTRLDWTRRAQRLKVLAQVMVEPLLSAALPGRNWRGEAPAGAAPAPDAWITGYATRLARLVTLSLDPAPVLEALLAPLAQEAPRLRPGAVERVMQAIVAALRGLPRQDGAAGLPPAVQKCLDRHAALQASAPATLAQLAQDLDRAPAPEGEPPLTPRQVDQVLAAAQWEAAPEGGSPLRRLHQAALMRLLETLQDDARETMQPDAVRETKHAPLPQVLAPGAQTGGDQVVGGDLFYLYDELSIRSGVMDLHRRRIPPAPSLADDSEAARAARRERLAHAQRLAGVRPPLKEAFMEVRRLLAPAGLQVRTLDALAPSDGAPELEPAEGDSAQAMVAKALMRRLLMDWRAVQAFEDSFAVPGEPPKARLVISDRKE